MRYTRTLFACLLVALVTSAASVRAFGQSGSDKPAYLDPSLPIDKRVDDLVSRMTLDEKASQIVHRAKAIPRLQIPEYNWWNEALHGVSGMGITVFPEPVGLGATFDVPLVHQMATVIGTEARAQFHDQERRGQHRMGLDFWAPNLNLFRDPRWGRGQETYGEDPFLIGRMGVAFVTGMQGDDPKYMRVISTPKHYAVHSGPEPLRHVFDAKASKHDMEDTYFPGFRAAVVEGKAGSVMCVYNRVNGDPGCASDFLLGETLREKWGFKGYVVSDCDAVSDIARTHHYTKTQAEAGAISLKRGTDLDCNDIGDDPSRYTDALKQGLMTEKDLDVAVKRIFRARFALGLFDPPEMVPYTKIPLSEVNTAASRELATKLSRESMVLLKNDGILPLKKDLKRIAVVGPFGDSKSVIRGNYAGNSPKMVTVLDGLRKQFPNAEITFSPGTMLTRGKSVTVPAELLSTPDGKPGLKGEYYKGIDLEGQPAATVVDKQLLFRFPAEGAPVVGPRNFSARWTGFLTPDKTSAYKLGVRAEDGFRMWLDDKLIVDEWTFHSPALKTAELTLEKGHKYAIKVEYFQGTGRAYAELAWEELKPENAEPVLNAAAAEDARKADLVVAVVGVSPELEGEEVPISIPGFKGGDRTSLDMPKPEQDLLEAVKATGKPLVIVLTNGSPMSVNWADKNANAILETWYSGEEGGTAIAQTLVGDSNPGGRLPLTFYASVDQLPDFENYSMQNRTYRYFTGKPLYPFGYGLSYTSFAYSGLKMPKTSISAGEPLVVEADVKNTGKVAGDEVVQVYLSFPKLPGAPIRALRGFKRVHLAPGEKTHVSFKLESRELSSVSEAGDHVIRAGNYQISVGGGQPGYNAPVLQRAFAITGEQKLPE
jgi:beta-glucosidase